MNSLNIISARVSPTSSPAPSRSNSLSHISLTVAQSDDNPTPPEEASPNEKCATTSESNDSTFSRENHLGNFPSADEKTPLLDKSDVKEANIRYYSWHVIPGRIANNLINSIRWVLSTIAAPGVYLVACFYDERGNFAPLRQFGNLFGIYGGDARKLVADYHESVALNEEKQVSSKRPNQGSRGKHAFAASRPSPSSGTSSSGLSSESESDMVSRNPGVRRGSGSSGRHARSKSLGPAEEGSPTRRSIRIKLNNDEAMRQRKHRKAQSTSASGSTSSGDASADLSAQLKSPTSPIAALTRYPKTPAPPRPLIPRRQPSYVPYEPLDPKQLKTLILDLDETLIHSMSKGGRMGSGHMVEVRLNTTYVGSGGQQALGPQHPILYYVHKRPHCDEFLRKVCKWFNLVVFTASVQEYADPVIDWLESERKFFSGRYYRQHCTFRHGAFIKDLSSIEPDLSKVIILDNSPLSYMFHQDNAIPIQGWINDPTDNDLLHLVPLLEGLQYVSDVRALLALRGGEDGQHMMT
ncbi:NLI interacting factor-like phosphatase-domain-containing protein [Daldinia vernicosa]|uniref:NLI interacting factor-like phosphatase-domain-containing protein n=1 Tax=Daldinia vernicosa TaxID=114800 RepID=UPI00200765FF|nr:NLI interacting factor-like phosphatase-domain-containing protein [Daldinia vernicosa]KAI0851327.1 NLI interacting factor-like phosphatase-domain-containing protein [Daldinia vernicosa]